ncbi:hypothetical protein ILUMI_07592 [Ignelater luminosus]|uniref:Medium-chain acyl-CoA ligase ACSF2, mitochondrial n=1 Tax=Ignelater luminosus TaxID=2038154 RepID=A0A8K0D390_IGNLU|nr:hypothetical protein ILUMI_07592 [Ignelater luminosus]
MASARAGFILVPLNPNYQAKEMEFCINKAGIKTLICPHQVRKINFYDVLNEISPNVSQSEPGKLSCKNIPSLKSIINISEDPLRGTFNFKELLELATTDSIKRVKDNQHLIQPDDPNNLQFTSGTTGKPKAALVSHFNVVNNSYDIGKRSELDKMHHKICVQVPFFHAFGIVVVLGSALNFGSTIVIPSPTYNAQSNLQAIKDERCSILYGTPTMYVDLVNLQKQNPLDLNLKTVVTGGASCSPDLFKQIKKHLKVEKVKSIYGLTEATAGTFFSLPIEEDEYKATGTVGYVCDHLEAKVVGQDNKMVPLGTPGELCIRGYSRMLGYWDDEEQTKNMISQDGWLKTGDQFVLQEDGYGRIVGRLKDMIIRGGENIFPKEIEDFLHTHPDILDVHVIGLSHERLGEEVCACISLREGATLTHDSLVEFCKGKIAHFKIPSQLKILDSFPKTTSGKIQKFLLKEIFENKKN